MHRLILGCILAAFLGGTIAVAQTPIAPTKPLNTPGLNQPLLVPPATTLKNSPNPAGIGLGLGAQSIPGISPVTNPQASKGGSDAEKIDKVEPRVTVRGFDKVDRLTRGGKSSEQAKGKSTEQKVWLPSNFRPNLPGADRPAKVDAVTTKQSTKLDEIGVARELAKPPSRNKKSGDDSAEDKPKYGTWGAGYTPDKSSTDKSKYGTWGPGYTPDKSSTDKSKFGTWGPGYTPDGSSTDKSKFGTWGPGYTPDKSSTDKSRYGTWGAGYTPDKSSTDKSKYGTWGPGYTPDKSSKDGSTSGQSQSEKQDDKNQSSQ